MKATVAVIMLASTCFGDALIDRMDLRSPGRVELPARAEVVMPYGSTVTYACYGARIEFDGWLDIVMAGIVRRQDVKVRTPRPLIGHGNGSHAEGPGLAAVQSMPPAGLADRLGRLDTMAQRRRTIGRHGAPVGMMAYRAGPRPGNPDPAPANGAADRKAQDGQNEQDRGHRPPRFIVFALLAI